MPRWNWPGYLPHWPSGRFDLIVLSEVGYYLDSTDWCM
jgi:hypothetical protein